MKQEPIPGKCYITKMALNFFYHEKYIRDNLRELKFKDLPSGTRFIFLEKLLGEDHKILVDNKILYLGLNSFFDYVDELK